MKNIEIEIPSLPYDAFDEAANFMLSNTPKKRYKKYILFFISLLFIASLLLPITTNLLENNYFFWIPILYIIAFYGMVFTSRKNEYQKIYLNDNLLRDGYHLTINENSLTMKIPHITYHFEMAAIMGYYYNWNRAIHFFYISETKFIWLPESIINDHPEKELIRSFLKIEPWKNETLANKACFWLPNKKIHSDACSV